MTKKNLRGAEWFEYRSCRSKRYYADRKVARRSLCTVPGSKKGLKVYPCKFCGGFHIGHEETKEKKKQKRAREQQGG